MLIDTKFNIGQKVKVKMKHRSKAWTYSDPEFIKDDAIHTGKIKDVYIEVCGRKKPRIEYLVSFDPKEPDEDEAYLENQLESVA